MARFAGDMDVSGFLSGGPDLGKLSQQSHYNDAKQDIAGVKLESNTGGAALTQFGEALGTQAVFEARGNLQDAQEQASNMTQIGGLFGQGLSGLAG